MGGGGVWKWGKRESIYLSLHCQHQNDSCIKVGSDEYPQTTTFEAHEKGETKQVPT